MKEFIMETRTVLDLKFRCACVRVRVRVYPFYSVHPEEERRPQPVESEIDAINAEG